MGEGPEGLSLLPLDDKPATRSGSVSLRSNTLTSGSYIPPKKTLPERLARESRRIGRQVAARVLPYWGHVTRIAYDARRASAVTVTEGRQALFDEVSVLLIYQPKGLLPSTIWQIEWMSRQGISTVVVSNTPLKEEDRQRLAGIVHLIVERPNVGYDFGGYREGVMQILDRGIPFNTLYVMNDSMWFPLSEHSDVIERCRAAPEDVWGLFVDLDWRQRTIGNVQGSHVQSYFFRFSHKVTSDPRFAEYWRKMSLISSKRIVIQLRELKLARHFADLGYSVGGLHSWREVVDFLLNLQDEEMMRDILSHQCQVNSKDAAEIEPLLARSDMTALQVRDALRDRIAKTNILVFSTALHPHVMMSLGFPFLKKQRVPAMLGKRQALLDMGLQRRFPTPIQREVETWDQP